MADALITHICKVLAPAQGWSCARSARWVRVWQWRRTKLGLDITAGQVRIRSVNAKLGRNVVDSESTTFTHVVMREAGVQYKVAQNWVRWGALGVLRLKELEGTSRDSLRYLNALWSALQPRRAVATPSIVGKWKHVEDRLCLPERGIELRLGDSQKLMAEFEPESFGGIVTDEPYGVDYSDTAGVAIAGDDDPEPIASWSAPAMARLLKPHTFAVLHGVFKRLADGRYVDEVWRRHLAEAGLPIVDIAVWDKVLPGPGGQLMHRHEQVWMCAKGSPPVWLRGQPDVWRFPRPADSAHPMPKPVDLHALEMRIFAAPGARVLDPFCGTGATALAALGTGHSYLGIEIDERWYSEACRRVLQADELPLAA